MMRSRFHSWSLRKRLGRASAAMVVLLAVLFSVISASLLDVKDKGDQVVDRWQPAYTLSQDLLADLVNQETGLRGFAVGRACSGVGCAPRYWSPWSNSLRRPAVWQVARSV